MIIGSTLAAFVQLFKHFDMKNAKNNMNTTFWNKNNKLVLAAGIAPAIMLLLYVGFGFDAMTQLAPGLNLLLSAILGFIAVIACLVSATYLSFSYMFMQSEKE